MSSQATAFPANLLARLARQAHTRRIFLFLEVAQFCSSSLKLLTLISFNNSKHDTGLKVFRPALSTNGRQPFCRFFSHFSLETVFFFSLESFPESVLFTEGTLSSSCFFFVSLTLSVLLIARRGNNGAVFSIFPPVFSYLPLLHRLGKATAVDVERYYCRTCQLHPCTWSTVDR